MTINSTTVGLSMEVLEKKTKNLKTEFPNNSSLSLLGIYPKGIKCSVKQRYIYTVPTMAVVIITFMVPVSVSITGWMNKDGVAHMHSAVYSEIKKKWNHIVCRKKEWKWNQHVRQNKPWWLPHFFFLYETEKKGQQRGVIWGVGMIKYIKYINKSGSGRPWLRIIYIYY